MSSLAAASADGYYYPPEFDPQKHGSLNKFRGSHPLGDRARKIDQGILIIRFELPWNIWCEGCGNHVGKGVRYNAEKKQAGMYFSTKLWEFKLRCHLCSHTIIIATDPKNRDYRIVEGARRRIEDWDAETNGSFIMEDDEEKDRLAADPMYRLERGSDDQVAGASAAPQLRQLYGLQERGRDPFAANQALRKAMRERKRKAAALEADGAARNLGIALLPEDPEADSRGLAGAVFHPGNTRDDKARRLARLRITHGSIFEDPVAAAGRRGSASDQAGAGGEASRLAEGEMGEAASQETATSEALRRHQLRMRALQTQIEVGIPVAPAAKRPKVVAGNATSSRSLAVASTAYVPVPQIAVHPMQVPGHQPPPPPPPGTAPTREQGEPSPSLSPGHTDEEDEQPGAAAEGRRKLSKQAKKAKRRRDREGRGSGEKDEAKTKKKKKDKKDRKAREPGLDSPKPPPEGPSAASSVMHSLAAAYDSSSGEEDED